MLQSNQFILNKRYQFSNLILSDPELDDLEKHPPDEESSEDIPYEEVIPEDAPPRKKGDEKPPLKKKYRDTEDKSDDNTPPAQL